MRFITLVLALLISSVLCGQEVCNNGIDDDGDGLVDLQDENSCPCTYSNEVGIPISLLLNPSFEQMDFCPTGPGEIESATNWTSVSDAQADYFSNCDPFGSVLPNPIPDGNSAAGIAAKGDFCSFVTAELTGPLIPGEDYRVNFDIAAAYLDAARQIAGPPLFTPIYLVMYGNVSTTNIPLAGVTTSIVAPTFPPVASSWEVIDSMFYTPDASWDDRAILFTPAQPYEMIAFGPPPDLPVAYATANEFPFFFIDDLVLNEEALFSTPLQLSGTLCLDNVLIDTSIPQSGLDWFHNGVALGENGPDLDVSANGFGQGTYSVSIGLGTGSCLYNFTVVPGGIYPEIDYSISDLCPFGPVTFTDNSTIVAGSIASTEWDFGIVPPSSLSEITADFPSTGEYDVTLSVTSALGCLVDSVIPITLANPPLASFSIEENCLGQATIFMDDSEPSDLSAGSAITSFEWSVEGVGILLGPNQEVTFPAVSDYEVSLTVTTEDGCMDDTTLTLSINPVPLLELESTIPCVGPVAFSALVTEMGNSISDLSWNFGDNTTAGNETMTQHQYSQGGEYMVVLTAETNLNCMARDTLLVTIGSLDVDFDYDVNDGCSPVCVQFEDRTLALGHDLVYWEWEFFDGTSSFSQNPAHCFYNLSHEEDSLFGVKLIVTDSSGCQDSLLIDDLITSRHIPSAAFSASRESVTSLDALVYLQNESLGATTYLWDFDEIDGSMEVNPSYSFDLPGIHEVSLISSSDFPCSDTAYALISTAIEETIYVPNSFSPNGDGINDLFYPVLGGGTIESYEFNLFDRDGHLVFGTTDSNKKWNGRYAGTEDFYVKDGAFAWTMKVTFEGKTEVQERRGVLTVIR